MEKSQVTIPYIPDDLLLNCLARVSRVYYPTLSLVSKRFRSLVSSHEIYRIRTLIGRTENCLYLYLRLSSENYLRWFTLCRGPTQIPNRNPNPNLKSGWFTSCFRPNKNLPNGTIKEENKSSDIRMVSVQTRNFHPPSDFTCTTNGPNIYMIGAYINAEYSRRELFYMDCRSHTWHKTPRMEVAPKKPLMKVLDGKIYVMEGCKNPDFSNFIKVFDPKTQIWEHVPNPSAEIRGSYISKSFVFDEKLYLYGDKTLAYKPKENKWDAADLSNDDLYSFLSDYSCIVDNVLYSYVGLGMFLWHDSKERLWLPLNGLEEDHHELPEPPYRCTKLLNYGEKIAVVWEKKVRGKKKMIWCAVIAPERRSRYEMYGKIEWCHVVLTVPESCSSLTMISVIV